MAAYAVLQLGHAWPRVCMKDVNRSLEPLPNYRNVSSVDRTLLFC